MCRPSASTLRDYEAELRGTAIGVAQEGIAAPSSKGLSKETNAQLAGSRSSKGGSLTSGATTFPGSPADLEKFIADETEKWGKVIRSAHIKVE